MTEGRVEPGFEAVREAFLAAHEGRGGGQLCIYRHGRPVLDVWTAPFAGDSITVLMSCTKGAVAVLVQMLVEAGELDLETPIAAWWPEFAAQGKEGITLTHVLTHSSGLFGWEVDSGMGGREALDWETSTAALAAMRPYWAPGSAYLYHFITYGYLIGEVIRRATGRTVGRQLADRIAGPLGLDLWIGLPASEEPRVVEHVRPAPPVGPDGLSATFAAMGLDTGDRLVKGIVQTMGATEELIDLMMGPAGRAPEVPAGNGVGDARSLARMYAAVIGEVDGVRLLKPETVEAMRRPRTDHLKGPPPLPPLEGDAQRFGLGVELSRRIIPLLGKGSFGHPGAGGRIAFADPESGVAVGYVCDGMLWDGRSADPRWAWMEPLAEAVRQLEGTPA